MRNTRQPAPIKRRASADQYAIVQQIQSPVTDVDDVSDSCYSQRMPTSVRRYVDTRGNQVIQQGNKRIVIHDEPPPKRRATVSAHALTSGKSGNVAALAINAVIGSSLYIRNLTAFSGGRDSYSVKFITSEDRALALSKSRNLLTASVTGLHYPCTEHVSGAVTVIWRCIFVKYSVPTYMHVTGARLSGRIVIVSVMYIEHPMPMRWVK